MENWEQNWTFWNVNGIWLGRRGIGSCIRAGTYVAVFAKAKLREEEMLRERAY